MRHVGVLASPSRERIAARFLVLMVVLAACASQATIAPSSAASPAVSPAAPAALIRVGTEYILIDNPARTASVAQRLRPIGLDAAKPLAEHIQWDAMQPGPGAPIDYSRLDAFVRSFHGAGAAELVIALRSRISWASRGYGSLRSTNEAPKPEYLDDYAAWISGVVERYDGDGRADMPGLLRPVRTFEIGSEFSSYEPEPVGDYLEMLEQAYAAAHLASPDVIVTHAAFLTTLAFEGDPAPADLAAAFRRVPDQTHSYADISRVLDRPDLFDVLNIHSIGQPDEIADIMGWLRREMSSRGYAKPVIISDTGTTPFIAWGPANVCDRDPRTMGRIIPPATEADRCRLAAYFTKLIDGDAATVDWVQGFAAADAVKKIVIAAEQGVAVINTAFTEDLVWLKLPLAQAGAGNSAWAGQIDYDRRSNRAGFYALKQVIAHLRGSSAIQRVPQADAGLHVYRLTKGSKRQWIAWYDPGRLLLPGDHVPTVTLSLAVGRTRVTVETLITDPGRTQPLRSVRSAPGGTITLTVGPTPLFIGT